MEPQEVVAGKQVFATKPVSEKLREIPYQEMTSHGSDSLLPQKWCTAALKAQWRAVTHAVYKLEGSPRLSSAWKGATEEEEEEGIWRCESGPGAIRAASAGFVFTCQ
ncbi:unnamed protein product [Rangifer tarandus platyrhynchus]|uniref:Uncharacterized protein n=1 Tax=Rangifer tarandus platyrhynchus TaxID=3082113 RepID=A0AC59Z3G9_RANTA